jgi:hypothetical protein
VRVALALSVVFPLRHKALLVRGQQRVVGLTQNKPKSQRHCQSWWAHACSCPSGGDMKAGRQDTETQKDHRSHIWVAQASIMCVKVWEPSQNNFISKTKTKSSPRVFGRAFAGSFTLVPRGQSDPRGRLGISQGKAHQGIRQLTCS